MKRLKFFLWIPFIFSACTLGPTSDTNPSLTTDSAVTVFTSPYYAFIPETNRSTTGFVFYPGANVAPAAYAPMASKLAHQGYTTIIVPMPYNYAIVNSDAANLIIAGIPGISNWVISGHSLGGAMACSYVYDNPGKMKGLVLLAGYPGTSGSLASSSIKVLSLHASLDGLATPTKISNYMSLLPSSTTYVLIEGGNHAQFGYYGDQSGDNTATISREDQQTAVVTNILNFLSKLTNP